MKTVTLCATADLHLGMRFSSYPGIQKPLIRARFDALQNVVNRANRDGCSLLIIAGDLFNHINVPASEIETTASIFAGFEGECIAVLPGNHDYYGGKRTGIWDSLSHSGVDTLLLLTEPRPYSLEHYHLPVILYPGPCTSKHSAQNAVSWIGPIQNDPEMLHIGVAHGSIAGISPDMNSEYYPMEREQLRRAGLDLWIIGHTHVPQPSEGGVNPDIIIPGTPEADGFDHSLEGGACLVRWKENNDIEVERFQTGTFRFIRIKKEVHSTDELQHTVDELLKLSGPAVLLQAFLRGTLPKGDLSLISDEIGRFENRFFYTDINTDGIKPRITSDEIGDEFREGSFPYLLLHRFAQNGDSEALQLSYRLLEEMKE